MSINYSTPGVLEVCKSSTSGIVTQINAFSDTVSNFAMVHQNSVLTSDAALCDAHLQIKDLQQQIQALTAKNLGIIAKADKTEKSLRDRCDRQIRDLIQEHHVVIELYRADIDRLITENQFWKKTSLKVVTDLTIMSNQNTRHKEELATYTKVSIGVVALSEVLLDTVSNFAMVHQNSVLTSYAALCDAHLQIKDLQQQIQALTAKNLGILARTEQTEDRLRRGYEGQISNLRRDHDVVIKSYCADIERLTADIQRLTNENQFWKNSLLKVGTHLTTVLKQNTRLKEGSATYENRNKTLKQEYRRALLQVDDLQNRLATYKKVSIGVVALCSLYPLASKFCTTETARMIANGAVQLCSALKRGLTGVKADQLV